MGIKLPDVALTETAASQTHLDWVGMDGIDLPIWLEGHDLRVAAKASAKVNLPAVHLKGIHMSRLYLLLTAFAAEQSLSPATLLQLLWKLVNSHTDCGTNEARVAFEFDLLRPQPALLSENLYGWRAFPVRIDATLSGDGYELRATVKVEYSSTCPCSAALARQLLSEHFNKGFGQQNETPTEAVSDWLLEHGSVATPHSQRSSADVAVVINPNAPAIELWRLIDRLESALQTPVQTAVKRADEQEFAKLNGKNLMYVEDACRRISSALKNDYGQFSINIRHQESLHPHDAVASLSYPAKK